MLITRSIPKDEKNDYPGLLAHRIDERFEIVVMGSGPEAEAVLAAAVERRRMATPVEERELCTT